MFFNLALTFYLQAIYLKIQLSLSHLTPCLVCNFFWKIQQFHQIYGICFPDDPTSDFVWKNDIFFMNLTVKIISVLSVFQVIQKLQIMCSNQEKALFLHHVG